jgi:hypothetical protein
VLCPLAFASSVGWVAGMAIFCLELRAVPSGKDGNRKSTIEKGVER